MGFQCAEFIKVVSDLGLQRAGGIWQDQALQHNDSGPFHSLLFSQYADRNGAVCKVQQIAK